MYHPLETPPTAPSLASHSSADSEADSEYASTLDLLKDRRWQPLTWFSDFAFATRTYSFGALFGAPTHVPDNATVEQKVLESVHEAEELRQPSAAPEPTSVSEYFHRMSSKPTMLAVRFLGWFLGKLWRAAFTSVLLHNHAVIEDAMRRADPRTALIILPTHRSHADYLLMSYIFFGLDLGVPLIAAGDNLNVSLLGSLLARAGAFFIKRASGSPRYRLVLECYLKELAKSGAPIEFFIEGGRSRRGHVGRPKTGLLSIIVDLVKDGELADALLVPCSLDYDAVPEAASLTDEVLGAREKRPESLWGTLKAGVEWLLYGARGGSVYVGFADRPLSVKELLAKFQRLATSRAMLEQHSLSEHLNRPLAIFRGGSNASLADQSDDAGEVGRLVCQAQRDAALITAGGVLACVVLAHDRGGEGLEPGEARCKLALQFAALLVDLGYANRIPAGTLTRESIARDLERAQAALGGGGRISSDDVRVRLKLRYVAAPVLARLLPVCVVACKGGHALAQWLCEMMDLSEELMLDLQAPPSLAPALKRLVAPMILVLSTVLDELATFHVDAVLREDVLVQRTRDSLAGSQVDLPETQAALEIVAALRACASLGVLVRSRVAEGTKHRHTYQLSTKGLDVLREGRIALDMARLALG